MDAKVEDLIIYLREGVPLNHAQREQIVSHITALEQQLADAESNYQVLLNNAMRTREWWEAAKQQLAAKTREAEFWKDTYRDLQSIRYGDDFVKQHMAELEAQLGAKDDDAELVRRAEEMRGSE